MRIISGASRGRRLATQRGGAIRPTSDRIKESVFNILGEDVRDKNVADLFAGTGNLGIEALSRGARKVVFLEKERQALKVIEKNLSICGMQSLAEIIPGDVNRTIGVLYQRGESFDLIFVDPPYRQGMVESTLMKLDSQPIYHEGSLLVVQHDRREPLSGLPDRWSVIRERRIGDTLISFIKPNPA